MTSRRRTFLTALAGFAAMAVSAHAQRSGYWQLQQGGATVVWGPQSQNQREWDAQGATVLMREAGTGGAIIRMSGMVGGGLNVMSFRSEWRPPQQVIPGEIISVTSSAAVLELNYARPQYPFSIEVAGCQWQGAAGPEQASNIQAIPATAVGQSATSAPSTIRAIAPGPNGTPPAGKMRCQLSLRSVGGLTATFPYAWVGGAAPSGATATLAPSTPAPPAAGGSLAGNWNADFNGYKGPMELTPAGSGWRGRFNISGAWEEMTNLRISGTSITFDRVNGGQHYEGQLGPNGFAGSFTYEGRPYRWTATRAGQAMPVARANPERELFFNGNDGGVSNGGKSPAANFASPVTVTYMMTYHWNGGRGAGNSGIIMLLHESGTLYGPWPVTVENNVYWVVRREIKLPAGRYQVIDSDPATWAQNGGSQGFGHVRIRGY